MKQKHFDTKKLVLFAMFSAIAYILVALIRIPVMLFLSYEPKDVVITMAGFLLGPMAAPLVSLVVSLVEMFTVSGTGPIGALMNFLSTVSFCLPAALIYKKVHNGKGALLGLLAGSIAMIGVMLLWNWLITPIYMGYPREAVEAMLIPVFLPFNALKAGLNSAFTMLLYKPIAQALRKANLLPKTGKKAGSKPAIYLIAGLLLVSCIALFLVLRGVL